jgi:anti-sigma regulatory factor (Ser/Thr protein kinase)
VPDSSQTTAMPRAAQVRLELSSKAANVPVVRQALAGFADATGLAPADLNDIGIALTEACNNASAYAYDGAEGPLEVVLSAGERTMWVTVRDHGIGLGVDVSQAAFPTDADGELAGIGLPSIQGLTEDVRWSEPAGGGTSVEMRFSTEALSWDGDGGFADLERPAISEEELAGTIEAGMAPLAVACGVLPRLLRAVGARAAFSIERHSAAQRVVSVLLADTASWAESGGVQARLVVEPASIELGVGPVTEVVASRLAHAVGPIAPRLSTSILRLGGGRHRLLVRLER